MGKVFGGTLGCAPIGKGCVLDEWDGWDDHAALKANVGVIQKRLYNIRKEFSRDFTQSIILILSG